MCSVTLSSLKLFYYKNKYSNYKKLNTYSVICNVVLVYNTQTTVVEELYRTLALMKDANFIHYSSETLHRMKEQ